MPEPGIRVGSPSSTRVFAVNRHEYGLAAREKKEQIEMKGKFLGVVVLTAVIGLLVAGCAPAATPVPPTAIPKPGAPTPVPAKPTEAPPAREVFKLGVLGPWTGPASRTGENMRAGIIMAFEDIDYKIGLYDIELVWIDSESDPEKACRAYEEAVLRDKIQAGLNNWHSSVTVATMELYAKYKIPQFGNCGCADIVNEKWHSDPDKYGYLIGKGQPVPSKPVKNYVVAITEAIEKGIWDGGTMRAACYGEDTDWGRYTAKAFKEYLEEQGWEVVAEDFFPIDETEFYPMLKRFKDLDVSLIGGTATSAAAISSLIKQSKEIGLPALVVADGLGWVAEWYEMTGEAGDYVLDQIPLFATEEAKAWKTRFVKRWGFEPSAMTAGVPYDYTCMWIEMAEATIEEYGELGSETLYEFAKKYVWTTEFVYDKGIIMPKFGYSAESIPDMIVDQGWYLLPVLQYFGGEATIIWPPEWKTGDLAIPDYMKE